MYKRILVPVDGSETSNKALAEALAIAREGGGKVHLLHCVDELAYLGAYDFVGVVRDFVRDNAARSMAEAAERCRAAGVDADSTLIDGPGQRLGDVVGKVARQWMADLIVAGTHGRRGIDRIVMGSGAEQIVRSAPVPVLVVRGTQG